MLRALLVLAAVMISTTAIAQTGPAVTLSPFNLNLFGASGVTPITQGWQFTPNSDITITELGFFDGSVFSDVGLAQSHDVAIFDGTGRIVVAATVPAGTGALFDQNTWFVGVPETHLSAGQTYTAAAFYPAPSMDPVLYTGVGFLPPALLVTPAVTWRQAVYSGSQGQPGLTYPTIVEDQIFGLFGPSFYIGKRVTEIQVSIDVKPGDPNNCVNINGAGTIPVAVLGSSSFPVNKVDQSSLVLDGFTLKVLGNKAFSCSQQDVNGDGFVDLLCHFVDQNGAWTGGTGTATLHGKTFDGAPFSGTDKLCLVPN